jgi:hypothetical protein
VKIVTYSHSIRRGSKSGPRLARPPHASTPGNLVPFGEAQAFGPRTWLTGFAARLGPRHLSGLAIGGLS